MLTTSKFIGKQGWGRVLIKNERKTLVTAVCLQVASRAVHTGSRQGGCCPHTPAWAGTKLQGGSNASPSCSGWTFRLGPARASAEQGARRGLQHLPPGVCQPKPSWDAQGGGLSSRRGDEGQQLTRVPSARTCPGGPASKETPGGGHARGWPGRHLPNLRGGRLRSWAAGAPLVAQQEVMLAEGGRGGVPEASSKWGRAQNG